MVFHQRLSRAQEWLSWLFGEEGGRHILVVVVNVMPIALWTSGCTLLNVRLHFNETIIGAALRIAVYTGIQKRSMIL